MVAGMVYGKVRQICDENQKQLEFALPSMAVEISGWKEQPKAGEILIQAETEEIAKSVVEARIRREKLEEDHKAAQIVHLRQLNNLEENIKVPFLLLPTCTIKL